MIQNEIFYQTRNNSEVFEVYNMHNYEFAKNPFFRFFLNPVQNWFCTLNDDSWWYYIRKNAFHAKTCTYAIIIPQQKAFYNILLLR